MTASMIDQSISQRGSPNPNGDDNLTARLFVVSHTRLGPV